MKKILIFCLIFSMVKCKPSIKGGEILPSFNLLLVDSVTKFNTTSIPEGKPFAILYFSPDCEHCQEVTEGILKKIDSLKNVHFYFITNDPFDRLQVYNKMYKLYLFPNITLARDYNFFILRNFKEATIPYLVIYDKNKRIRATFSGGASGSQIIDYIKQL
ncbi:TlpA family protein disulfide reductase [Flavitalea flava]